MTDPYCTDPYCTPQTIRHNGVLGGTHTKYVIMWDWPLSLSNISIFNDSPLSLAAKYMIMWDPYFTLRDWPHLLTLKTIASKLLTMRMKSGVCACRVLHRRGHDHLRWPKHSLQPTHDQVSEWNRRHLLQYREKKAEREFYAIIWGFALSCKWKI